MHASGGLWVAKHQSYPYSVKPGSHMIIWIVLITTVVYKHFEVISTVSGSDIRILHMFRKQAKPRAYGKVPLKINSKSRESFSFISVGNTMEPSYSRLQLSNKHVSNINNISHNKLWLVSWFYCSWNQLCNTVSFSVFCDFWLSVRSTTGWI